MIGGDFNSHLGTDGEYGIPGNVHKIDNNGKLLVELIRNTGLSLVNNRLNHNGSRFCVGGPLTFFGRQGSTSIIDYIVVDKDHEDCVLEMNIDDGGENGLNLDHAALYVSFEFGKEAEEEVEVVGRKVVKWVLREEADWNSFRKILDQQFLEPYL